jgi:hypothetical protein
MNMLQTIVPKSDQLNADDLIGQSLTIKVSEVRFKAGDDQPVSIHFDGDNGKPYKPCKSMRRVLVQAWGADANKYVGRSMSLVRDPKVQWGGQAVGGIRITHLSDIESTLTMALTATRGSRKPYTVNVLAVTTTDAASQAPSVEEYEACKDAAAFSALEKRRADSWKQVPAAQKTALKAASDAAKARLSKPAEFDPAAALERIKSAGDTEFLKQAWAAVCDHFDRLNQEVPVEFDAAYKFTLETLSQ